MSHIALLRRLALLAAALSATFAVPAQAQGDLLVAPTRLVVSCGGSTQVVLSNIGSAPATYRITLEMRRMNTNGEVVDVPEVETNAREKLALSLVTYAPRRITLQPNQPQSVRVSVRPPADLPDGEYRVHMSFRAIPAAAPVTPADAAPATGVSIRLTPIYGITIPVIYRKGQTEAGATIANPRLVTEGKATLLKLDMTRTGNRSVFGEIWVLAPGQKDPVFLTRGIAIYPEITQRALSLPVPPAQAALLKGPMRIEYREPPELGGKVIASTPASFR